MKNFLPAQNKPYTYLQTNRSDDLGSLWSTFNVDLQSNLGTLRAAPRMKLNTSTADQVNLGRPIGFRYFDGRLWTIAGDRVFRNTTGRPESSFSEDASSGFVTDYDPDLHDLEVFSARLWTVSLSGLYSKSSATGAWTLRSSVPGASVAMLCYFRKFDRLYITINASQVDSIDTSSTYSSSGDYTIQLGSSTENTITAICETSDSLWLGTTNREDQRGRGSVYRWDGISAQATSRYYLDAQGACALVVYNDIPYVMDSFGVFSKFTGSSFEEIGRLPFSDLLPDNTGDNDNKRFIHPKGIVPTKNGTFLFLVNNPYENSAAPVSENFPAGIWEFSEQYGFTHKYALTYTKTSTITDYGQNKLSIVGGLSNVYVPDTSANRNGMIMCGATYFTDATTTTSGIFYDDSLNTLQKKAYFVTTWFTSQEVEDKWLRLWTTYRRFLNANDSMIFKYRIYEEEPIEATITWVNTTSFTTTTDITAYSPTATGFNGTVGGEVEILQGTGGGTCSHITSVVNNAGTYTVTLDNAVTGVTTGTAKARFQKWIKLFPEVTGQVKSWEQLAIGAQNPRIQIKCCVTFQGNDEFHKLAIFSNEDIKISA